MITALDVSLIDDTNYLNDNGNKLLQLNNIKKINIFIGENNSGKSRMLRSFVKNDKVIIYSNEFISDSKTQEIKNKYNELIGYIKTYNKDSTIPKINISEKIEKYEKIDDFFEIYDCLTKYIKDNGKPTNYNANILIENMFSKIHDLKELLQKPLSGNNYSINKKISGQNIIYIPILRGIECFNTYYQKEEDPQLSTIMMTESQRMSLTKYKNNVKVLYTNKISKAYEIKDTKKIFTAENLYDEITEKLLGKEEDRTIIKDFQDFISREFYDGDEFTIIPRIDKGYLSVKIGTEPDKALHNLGDGIKQLITLFYKIFEQRNKEVVFLIEEPEINLHPGYQRKFIELLESNYFPNHQYFITTHSNHLIDSCFDFENVSIYKFVNVDKNNNTFKVINTTSKDIEILDLLGVNNSSVFLSNCTIWVEGISDKILISKYLSIYMKDKGYSYKEDINYSFIEYGGNNITHWAFEDNNYIETINASGITNRSFIICDNDNDGKQERKEMLKNIFGEERYFELDVREIENTISRGVLEKTLFNGKEPKYLKKYTKEAYATKSAYMGDFIDKHYDLNKKYSNRIGKTKKGSGTIKEKLSFAKKISFNISDINDLSISAQNLCENICKFIEESNK